MIKLKRIIWRLQEQNQEYFTKNDIEIAIMHECGTDDRTIKINFDRLKKLKWIKCFNRRWFIQDGDYY